MRRQRELMRRLKPLTLKAASAQEFVAEPQLVVFARDDPNCTVCNAVRSAAAMLDEPLLNVSFARCRPQRYATKRPRQQTSAASESARATQSGAAPRAPHGSSGAGNGQAYVDDDSLQSNTDEAAVYKPNEYPSAAQQMLAVEQSSAYSAAMRKAREDEVWYGTEVDTSDADVEALERLEAVEREGSAGERRRLRALHVASMGQQRLLGVQIWRHVERGAVDDIGEFESLLADAAKAERVDEAAPRAAAYPAWDWQQRGNGTHRGFTALMLACERGDVARVRMLIQRGAAMALPLPFLLGGYQGTLPVHSPLLVWSHAIDHGQLETAKLVMEALNTVGTLSETMQRAVSHGQYDEVHEVLAACAKAADLAKGTDDEAGWSLLCLDLVRRPGSVQSGGCTLLGLATIHRDVRMAELLLTHHANAEQSCTDGFTPLSWATIHCDSSMVQLLELHGASESTPLYGRALEWLSWYSARSSARSNGEPRYPGNSGDVKRRPGDQLPSPPHWDVQAIRIHSDPCAYEATMANILLPGMPPTLARSHAPSPVQLGSRFLRALQQKHSGSGQETIEASDLLRRHPQLSVLRDREGRSALCTACAAGFSLLAMQIVRLAIADPNCVIEPGGASALMLAVAQRDRLLVDELLIAGANVSYVAVRVRDLTMTMHFVLPRASRHAQSLSRAVMRARPNAVYSGTIHPSTCTRHCPPLATE